MTAHLVVTDLDLYWVENRISTAEAWERHHPLAVGWDDAIAQLRASAEGAFDPLDDTPDDIARECRHLLADIDEGRFDQATPGSRLATRYSRIVPAGPRLSEPIAARLRFLVAAIGAGRCHVTLQTRGGHAVWGTVTWDAFDHETVTLVSGGNLIIQRLADIESFSLERPTRWPATS